jgi:hypothetical protein
MMLKAKSSEEAVKYKAMMQNSVARMAKMIDSVMDFARGRMGGGLTLTQRAFQALEPLLDHVVAELVSAHPERVIETYFELGTPVYCDAPRIGSCSQTCSAMPLPMARRTPLSASRAKCEIYASNCPSRTPDRPSQRRPRSGYFNLFIVGRFVPHSRVSA